MMAPGTLLLSVYRCIHLLHEMRLLPRLIHTHFSCVYIYIYITMYSTILCICIYILYVYIYMHIYIYINK